MAKRSYLSAYKESDRRGMTSRMPDAVKGSTDLTDEAAARRKAYYDPLRTPSLDDLHGRWKRDDRHAGPLTEYPEVLAHSRAEQAAKWADPAFRAVIKRLNILRRKNKGYDIEQLMLDKMGGANLHEDELDAIELINGVRDANAAVLKLEKLITSLEEELEEEKSMQTSFDRNTRRLYSGLRVQNMEADLAKLRENLAMLRQKAADMDAAYHDFINSKPKKDKDKDKEPKETTTKAILIKADKK